MALRSRIDIIASHLDEEIDPAMRQIAEEIVAGAKARVPVESGALQRAIHLDRRAEGEYAAVAGDTNAYYGHIVEHGSAAGGRGRGPQPPRPFLIPAAEAAKQHIDDRVPCVQGPEMTTAAILKTVVNANTTAAVRDLRQYDSYLHGVDKSSVSTTARTSTLGKATGTSARGCARRLATPRCRRCLRLDRPSQGCGHHHTGPGEDHGGTEPQPRLHGQGGLRWAAVASRATSTPSR